MNAITTLYRTVTHPHTAIRPAAIKQSLTTLQALAAAGMERLTRLCLDLELDEVRQVLEQVCADRM